MISIFLTVSFGKVGVFVVVFGQGAAVASRTLKVEELEWVNGTNHIISI